MSVSFARFPSGEYASSTTEHALTNVFEVRWRITVPTVTPTARQYIVARWVPDDGWRINTEVDGRLRIRATFGGVDSNLSLSDALPASLNGVPWYGRLISDGTTISWEYSLNGEDWIDIGGGSAASEATTDPPGVPIGVSAANGNGTLSSLDMDVYRVRIWTGGDASTGTLRYDFDPNLAPAGQPADFVAATGETWTFNGTEYEVFHEGVAEPLTLAPDSTIGSDGVEDQAGLTAALHEAINEDWATPDDDTTYIVNSGDASGHAWLGLTNTPSDFESMTTLNIRVRLRRES